AIGIVALVHRYLSACSRTAATQDLSANLYRARFHQREIHAANSPAGTKVDGLRSRDIRSSRKIDRQIEIRIIQRDTGRERRRRRGWRRTTGAAKSASSSATTEGIARTVSAAGDRNSCHTPNA